jgi:hypothetical protein
MEHGYTYEATLEASQRANWRIEDVIGGDKRLDFDKPFMPESLAQVGGLDYLNPAERQALNQIRGHNYLYLFGAVEEFILPFLMDHVRPQLHGDDYRVRALLQFACEEAKHIQLFKSFRSDFVAGFGTECEVIGPPHEIARVVLSHHPLAVALTILHIEWMTQRHYVESVHDDSALDPQFRSLLRFHWKEEAQHAKLDTLIVESMAEACGERDRRVAVEDYAKIGAVLDGGIGQQVAFDVDSFERATGRLLRSGQRAELIEKQRQAMRWTFLGSGMTHPRFLATLERVSPAGRRQVEEMAPAFC